GRASDRLPRALGSSPSSTPVSASDSSIFGRRPGVFSVLPAPPPSPRLEVADENPPKRRVRAILERFWGSAGCSQPHGPGGVEVGVAAAGGDQVGVGAALECPDRVGGR